jgi:uncharacterized protein YdiU (UPF0061 family)
VREVLAAEALHSLGVHTSRCLSLVETGESLWRGDEPSPTRASVMIRFSRSHIRFGTFERLHYLKRPDLITKLLDHVIAIYYPEVPFTEDRYAQFYADLVKRVARLAAQWMAAGFCHGVLNTDNMSITGESFDYGPYGFINNYNPHFIAAYFDYGGRYSFGNQPLICQLNLELLQAPLSLVMSPSDLASGLATFADHYLHFYRALMLQKLGLDPHAPLGQLGQTLINQTLHSLQTTEMGYHQFFTELTQSFNAGWREDESLILENVDLGKTDWSNWRSLYHQALKSLSDEEFLTIGDRLQSANPKTALLRPLIEEVWEAIAQENNWQPFQELVRRLQTKE